MARDNQIAPSPGATVMGSPLDASSLGKAIFRKEGEYWTLGYLGKVFRLKDSKGLADIVQLLAHPTKEFHALELTALGEPSGEDAGAVQPGARELEEAGIPSGYLGDAGEMLDAQAKAAYRRELTELRKEEAAARVQGHIGLAEKAKLEIDVLVAELSRATGLGGRDRVAASASERARQSITRRIRGTLGRIADHHLPLARMLAQSIRTGTFCSYNPEPNSAVSWEFEPSSLGHASSAARPELPADIPDKQATPESGEFTVSWPSSLSPTDFVGRDHEIQLLRNALDRTAAGTGGMALIGGGAGVGKTRLAMETVRCAKERGFRSFAGRCYEKDEPFPYLPFAEILELMLAGSPSAEEFRREMGNAGGELAQIAPNLRRVFADLPPPPDLPAPQLPRFIFQGFTEFLSRETRRAPLLLVLDDLHWADQATLALLDFVVQQRALMPLLILGTYRDSELDSNPALVRSLDRFIREGLRPIGLRGLSHGEMAEMIRSLSMREPPLVLVQMVFEETQGNPFFVEEIYKHLVEEGKLFDATGEFRSGLTLDENDVPEHVRLVLRRRLQRLSETARQILMAAAVIGRSFSFELLQSVLGSYEVGDLLAAIEQAQRMELVVSVEGLQSATLNFAHELVRQTLLIDTGKPRRQRLHLAVAEAIEQLDAGRLSEQAAVLAHHLRRAGHLADPAKTAGYFLIAGRHALEGAAYEEAYRSFETATSYKELDLRRRAECLQGMERANRGLGHWEEALRRCNEAVEIYRQLGDSEMTANGIYETVDALLLMGQYQAAAEMGQRGLKELKDEAGASRADILAALGLTYAVTGEYTRARSAFSEAMSLANRLSSPRLLAGVQTNLSVLNGVFLEVADDLSNSRAPLEWDQSNNFPWMRAIALNEQMMTLHRVGRVEEACRVSKELEPLARKIGHVVFLATCIWTNAWAEFGRTADLMRLEEQLGQSVELCRARAPMITAQSLAQLSLAKFFSGQQSSALDCVLEASQLEVPGYLEGFIVGTIFRERAYAGDHAGAMAVLNDTSVKLKLPRENQANTFGSWALLVSIVEGLAMLGERERAAEFYPMVCALLDTGMITFFMMARFPRTIVGVAASAARQWQSAEEHFRIALRQAEEMPDRLERAECRRFYASMLLDRGLAGDRQEARRLLSDALGDYSSIRMPLHIEIIETLLSKI